MDVLAFLLFPILGVITILQCLSPNNKGRKLRIAFYTFGIPLLIFFGDEIVGQSYLHARCALEGGYKITNPVQTDGYFFTETPSSYHNVFCGCAMDCLDALLVHRFKYFEEDVKCAHPNFTKDQGTFRFYLSNKQSGVCSTEGRKISGGWGKIPTDKCIAYTKLQKPESRYEVGMATMDRFSSQIWFGPFTFQKNFSYVKDRLTQEIVGSETSFWYWGGWLRNNSFGHNSATVCPSDQVSHWAIFKNIITSTAN